MTARALIIGLSLAVGSVCAAEYSSRIWRIEDGLPQNKIQALAQTRDGYLWIGTSGGLVRFDGARFVVFDRSNTPALRDDSILSLLTARDGSLWIGTEGGGLAHLHSNLFESWDAREGLTNGFIRNMREDSKGRLWIGTDRGFFQFAQGKFHRMDGKGDVPILSNRGVSEDASGVIWVSSSRGLFRIDGDRLVRASSSKSSSPEFNSLIETAGHTLWQTTEAGLRRISGGKVTSEKEFGILNARKLLEDHAGNVWVGTLGHGLAQVSAHGVVFFHSPDPLPDESILSELEDREHNLWVGTQDGLLRLTETTVRTLNSGHGLADDNVTTAYTDPAGKTWISTSSGVLYRMEGERPVRFSPPPAFAGFRPRSIYVDPEGVQWLGGTNQGLLRIEKGRPQLITMADGMRSNSVRDVLKDRKGMVWIATGSGLTRWDRGSIRTFYLEDGLAYGSVHSLAVDASGDLLVGTDGGINRVRDSRFIADPVFQRLANTRVWSILPGTGGVLWLGTRGDGLIRIQGNTITRYTTREGLPSNSVYQILDDGNGRLWMSSAAGIFSALRTELDAVSSGRPGPIAVIPFDTDDGMPTSQMNGGVQGAGCIAANGELWFPSVKGAVRIVPKRIRNLPAAPVLIEGLLVDERSVPPGPISLAPGVNRIQIDFTSPNLAAPDRVSFSYKLEGFDDVWIPALRRRSAWFTNLPPRSYRFRVRAQDVAQPSRISEASLAFDLRPHYYQSRWFYAAMAGFGALLVLGVFRLYARQTKARYALVLAERTRLAREMHDTVIQGCLGVSTLLEAARSIPIADTPKSKELVDRAASQIRLTVNEAREAVWDLRHSSVEHGLTGSLLDFAQQVSASEGIPVSAEVDGSPAPLNENAGRNLLLVAREAVRNAVLHGNAGQIKVKLHFESSMVRLEVEDNGQGFNLQKPHQDGHYGIVGMRERVEQSGGVFELRSFPGRGTSVIAELPLAKQGGRNA